MSDTTTLAMSTYEARKATFLSKEPVAGPSRKKASSSAKLVWPHPVIGRGQGGSQGGNSENGSEHNNNEDVAYPSPRSMANLGLYYSPTSNANDQCAIYPDGQLISGWRQGQTAFDRLLEEDPTITWVMIEKSKRASEERRGGEKFVWNQSEDDIVPTGKLMVDARLRTFGGVWPLDGKKGWKPTSKKLSSAGFHFSPNEDEEDCVTCAYCQCSLGGWEKADDPVKEHQKRKPECAIFNSVVEKKAKETGSRIASTSSGKGRTASKKRGAETMEADEADEATTSKSSKKVAEDMQVEEESNPVQAKPAPKKKKAASKAKKTTKKVTASTEEKEEEEHVAEAKAKKGSKKAKAKAVEHLNVEEGGSEENQMNLDEKMVEASDFEEEPSRSHSRDSEKMTNPRLDSPPTSCESETFKTPKQTASARISQKTPKISTPPFNVKQSIGIPALKKLDLTDEEKA